MQRTLTAAAILAALTTSAFADAPDRFDVAEDLTRFVFAASPVFEDGMPAYGNAFITQGYIYEAGTLDGGVEGTTADGQPAFPERVIGTWTCDGYMIGNGMRTETGDIVVTRQVFQFEDGSTLITQGTELVDTGVPHVRAVTGGTGEFADAGPEMTQVLLGMSDGYGVRIQFQMGAEQAAGVIPESDGIETAGPAERTEVAYGTDVRRSSHTEWDSGGPVGPVTVPAPDTAFGSNAARSEPVAEDVAAAPG